MLARTVRDRRGIALPMALFTLLLLTSLSIALVTLAQTEPTIATNHLHGAQAHAVAESGLERALWALTHATSAGGIGGVGTAPNIDITDTPAAPYDGSVPLALGTGRFRVTVSGTGQNLRTVVSLGWSTVNGRPTSTRPLRIVATLVRLRNLARELPCALCVNAPLSVSGSRIDARGSDGSDCGAKVGVYGTSGVVIAACTDVFGAGAPASDATTRERGRDWVDSQPRFPASLTDDDLDTLKALATLRGTYVRPPSSARFDPVGVRDGLVFVDTPDGTNTLTDVNRADVAIAPGFSARVPFKGWVVVNGNVTLVPGAGAIEGLVYARNAVSAAFPGNPGVTGAIVAAHALDARPVSLVGVSVAFDCAAARGAGQVPIGWFVKPGSYCDASAGC